MGFSFPPPTTFDGIKYSPVVCMNHDLHSALSSPDISLWHEAVRTRAD
jgi:hypothetical protein